MSDKYTDFNIVTDRFVIPNLLKSEDTNYL